jgi:multidrug transporter EmrE-like cation transporter
MSLETLANIIGMLGTTAVVAAYFMIQVDRMDPKGLAYNLWNLLGAVLLLLSLLVHFNLASFVIELFWIAASVVGLHRVFKHRRQNKTHSEQEG